MIHDNPQRQKPLALVVDDDLSLRIPMGAALKKSGFNVIEAENGHQALDLFTSQGPDLVLLDVMMPEMDGFETCTAIRGLARGLHTQILMVTGLDDTVSIEKAFEAGANDFVSKPINWTMLSHRARYMLRAGKAFEELNRNRNRLAKTQELAKLGNWQIDLGTKEFNCSREACRLLGLTPATGVTFLDFLSPIPKHKREMVKNQIDKAITELKTFALSYPILLSDAPRKHILNQGEIVFNEKGVPELMLGVVQDITQLKQAEEEIRLLAFYDGLTGLANRMLFLDRVDQAIIQAKRYQRIFALLFINLDRFKRINDTLGHHAGDLLLKQVARDLSKSIRGCDSASKGNAQRADCMIARLGGDEFTILLSNINTPEDAALVARRIIRKITEVHTLDDHEISVTTSIGISLFPQDGEETDTLLKNADSAMYHAKENGRNNYQFYTEALNRKAMERFNIERDLKEALEKDQLVLYYQPQMDLNSRKIIGAEALIRWIHPEKGLIPPNKFIPIAEESGQIIEINKWVLKTACRQNRQWRESDLPYIRMAVNLSGYKLADQGIVETVTSALENESMAPDSLEIEITENILMQDTRATISTLERLKAMNLRISLDDFGTGYSSLSYLTSFPVDAIKIDRSFVMECTTNEKNLVVIKAIIAMGRSLGKTLVAEGIETEEQLELIRHHGCDQAQGYYFSPPVPEDKFSELLAQDRI
ncbi:MAG: EAL domain-containing protein [Desulfobacteraceae bacterium]|nr:EAL domain-containing protein [Desulfobacteraceae bacterium]